MMAADSERKRTARPGGRGGENGKHLLLVGKEGSGLTQVAKWFSWYFTPEEKRKENFLFIFSPETTVSDMIGKFTPKPDSYDSSSVIFEWMNGPLTLAVKNGYCGVFDNINFAPAKVIESLNALLEPKDMEEDYYFETPQNVYEPKVRIHPDFLFIATCTLEQMEKLSPAFLNRFIVINLDDQFKGATDKDEKEAIKKMIESEKIKLFQEEKIIDKIHTIYKENKLNMSSLSRLTKATVRIFDLIENEDKIENI